MSTAVLIGTNKLEVVPALAARDDVDVVVVTEPWYADRYRAAGFGAVHVVDSVTDYSALLARCGALMRDRPFDAVLAPSERSVQPAALLRSYFGLPGTGFDVAVALSTKHVMKRKLADAGLPVADWRPARSLSEIVTAIDDLGGRVIVKPSHGVGSVGYPVFDAPCDPEEVVSRMRDTRWSGSATNPAAVVERFLDVVAEYHVDAVVVDGRTPFVAVSRYTIPPLRRQAADCLGSITVLRSSPVFVALERLLHEVVLALGIVSSIVHLEVIETPDGYVIGEVAARPGGGHIVGFLKRSHGLDLWDALVAIETGEGHHALDAATEPTQEFASIMLGASPGVVESHTPLAEIAAIDGVVHAELGIEPGATVSDRATSSSHVGLVDMKATADRSLDDVIADVCRTWTATTRQQPDTL